ncbi:MAG: hypothetical protein ChlgKO_07650 [Chlamydiales bacterium]
MSNAVSLSGRCAFVVNIPMRVESDSEEEYSSSDEEIDGSFEEKVFEEPDKYFQLCPKRKNSILRGPVLAPISQCTSPATQSETEKTEEIFNLFREEDQLLEGDLLPRAKLVLGLNKMRSLSRSRNRSLQKHLDAYDPSIPVKKIAFFWNGIWQKKYGRQWLDCSYEEVRKFYKQLKRKGLKKAQDFRSSVEGTKSLQIPFRELRDQIKNSPETINSAEELRELGARNVFLFFFDGDLQSLRSDDSQGPFSIIDKHADEADIISTGYTVRESSNIPLELGVLADLVVREATAKIFPNGVYYPEPCTAIKIEDGKDTITENFSDGNSNYTSPKEMPILIGKILKARKLDPRWVMKFDSQGSIITTAPPRMLKQTKWDCRVNSIGQLKLFNKSDIKRMRRVSQTHYSSFHWPKYLLPALDVHSAVELFNVRLETKAEVQRLTVGILSRIFKLHDPIEKALEVSKRKSLNFVESMNDILSRWHSECEMVPPLDKPKNPDTNVQKILEKIKNSKEKLRDALRAVMVSSNQARMVYFAANNSGNAIWELFNNNLWHKSIANMMLMNLSMFSNCELPEELKTIEKGSILDRILQNEPFNIWDYLKHNSKKISPLHIAALTGNIDSVEKVISYGDSLLEKDYKERVPFVYGLIYCEMNGVDVDLLLTLLGEEIIPKDVKKYMLAITPGLETEIEESDASIEKRVKLLAKLGCRPTRSFKEEIECYDAPIEVRNYLLKLSDLEPLIDPLADEESGYSSDDTNEILEWLEKYC